MVTWKSKRKKHSISWAALRSGFCVALDWGGVFYRCLRANDFPGADFLMCAPNSTLTGFTRRPADWSDATRALHAVLRLSGVKLDVAVSYSLHSLKHVYPTIGRQLGLTDPQIDVMANWVSKTASAMPARYDSAVAVVELRYKAFVVENIVAGFRLVVNACKPLPPLVLLDASAVATPAIVRISKLALNLKAKSRSISAGNVLASKRQEELLLPPNVVQVLNSKVGVVHLYVLGRKANAQKTACGSWKCGFASSPWLSARFAKNSTVWSPDNCAYSFCAQCYGRQYLSVTAVAEKLDGFS